MTTFYGKLCHNKKSMAKSKDLRTGAKQGRTRDEKGRFIKGTTGNPGGRPKSDVVADRLFPLVPKAIERIKMILENPESTDRDVMKAAEIVLDRVYGKAYQAVQLDQAESITVRIEGCEDYGD